MCILYIYIYLDINKYFHVWLSSFCLFRCVDLIDHFVDKGVRVSPILKNLTIPILQEAGESLVCKYDLSRRMVYV